FGRRHVSSVGLRSHPDGGAAGAVSLTCDLLAMSGGWNPVIHLFAQSQGRPRWCDQRACFVPGQAVQAQVSVGAANGDFSLAQALSDGWAAGRAGASRPAGNETPPWQADAPAQAPILPVWQTLRGTEATRGAKQFIDYQNDVSVSDIYLAVREGYHSIEHVKRYTAVGFGTDQGKMGNIRSEERRVGEG